MATCRQFCRALLLPVLLASTVGLAETQGESSLARGRSLQGDAVSDDNHEKVASTTLPPLPANEVRAAGMFSYHKELFPVDYIDGVTFVLCGIGLLIAAGGGIGGGGILVPLLMILLGFRPKHAIALSNLTIFGGSIANVAFNLQKRQPSGKSMIDWDIIVIMEPSTIAGAVVGSYASKYLPDFVLTVALCLVLSILSMRTLQKGITMCRKEDEEAAKLLSSKTEQELQSFQAVAQTDGDPTGQKLQDNSIPWNKVSILVACFVGCVVLTILKGSGHGSIIGVECGSTVFWLLSFAPVPWVILFGWYFRRRLLSEYDEKVKNHHVFHDEIEWNTTRTITYPLICTLAGVFAGLFGVGGGIVKGPLMLEMGVNPSVAAATAATMIFFTTSAACVSFVIFGILELEYGVSGFIMGLVCTAVGQAGINAWMKAAKRQSPPVLSIGFVMAFSTLLVGIEAYVKFTQGTLAELLAPSSICAVDA